MLNLSPNWKSTHPYFGAGLEKGQCGVTIDRVKAINHGTVRCFLGVEGSEKEGDISLTVACKHFVFLKNLVLITIRK